MNLAFNFFCLSNNQALFEFYQALLQWEECIEERSSIYCSLKWQGIRLGFHARPAYDLLDIAHLERHEDQYQATAYPTFYVDTYQEVDALAEQIKQLDGAICKTPFRTYYNQWQVVARDPQGNLFRFASLDLPPHSD